MSDGREKQTPWDNLIDQVLKHSINLILTMVTQCTVVVDGKCFNESVGRLCREGNMLRHAKVQSDQQLELSCGMAHYELILSYLDSLLVDGDRNGLVDLPSSRGKLKKLKADAELFELAGLKFMVDKVNQTRAYKYVDVNVSVC